MKTPKLGISLKYILTELIIVFCGVYLAFYLSDRAEENKINKQSTRMLKSLKIELEQMRVFFPGQSQYMESKLNEWIELYQNNQWGDYHDWRYLQPQYNTSVLEYALNERETKIIDFELYKALMQVNRNLQQLIDAENAITRLSYEYHPAVASVEEGDTRYQLRQENLFSFYKFILASRDRANTLARVAELADKAVQLINSKFTRSENIEMTIELGRLMIESGEDDYSREELVALLNEGFPDYSENEVDYILEELGY